ncbi:MAG TPA: Ni/Fe hydrogenase subunit alpha [Candidatus Limnocylindrales bacterium]
MTRITIDPVTRLEGHARIEILLDEAGDVARTYFQVPELRGFERFCIGRPVEEMPILTNRICGVCPEAHHMASAKAADAVYGLVPPRPARLLRELLYSAFYFADHTTHFYALGGPDFIIGPEAPAAERNLLGVAAKVGPAVAGNVLEARRAGHRVIELIGGRKVHPVSAIPGGLTKSISEAERSEVEGLGRWAVEFAQGTLQLFEEAVLAEPAYRDLLLGDAYADRTHYLGLVDEAGRVAFYDGQVRVVDPDGRPLGNFSGLEYRDWIAERVEPWTYLKFPYLRPVGWRGLVDGSDSGVYCVGPLGRLNVADGMATPLAQAEFERYHATLGSRGPDGRSVVHNRLGMHWARLIELLQAAERMVELATDPEVTSPDVRVVAEAVAGEGVGIVEAPRGTLIHHYRTDERGLLTNVNLIVGTTHNYAPICLSVERAARSLIHAGSPVTDGLLNRIEMAFRAYDPCFGCATHALPGRMPLEVTVRDVAGAIVQVARRD